MKQVTIPEVVMSHEFDEIPITILLRGADDEQREYYKIRLNDIFYFHHIYFPVFYSKLHPEMLMLKHMHPGIEILYVTHGEGLLILGDGPERIMHEGDIVFINSFEPHFFKGMGNYERLCVTFLLDIMLKYLFPGNSLLEKFSENRLSFCGFIPTDDPINLPLRELLDDLVRVTKARGELWKLSVQTDIMRLLSLMIESGKYAEHSGDRPDTEFYSRIMRYINSAELSEISAASTARSFDYSEAYFCRKFKQTFKQSFVEFLNNCKIMHAKRLMSDNPDMSIAQVCAAVGFSNPSYFTLLFKRLTGVNPSVFRQDK